MATIGQKIKEYRVAGGFSQEEIAKVMGINRVTLSQIENDERKVSATEKAKFAEIFEIDQSDFDAKKTSKKFKNWDKKDKYYKFKNMILYILNKCGGKPNVGEIVLNKLLYFCDFNNYELSFEPIGENTYIKLPRGPVPQNMPEILEEMISQGTLQKIDSNYFGFKQKRYIAEKEADVSVFNGNELKIIDDVLAKYADKNATWLTNFSHEDMPYKATQKMGEIIEYGLAMYRSPIYSVLPQDEGKKD